jgi:hypothetical protein
MLISLTWSIKANKVYFYFICEKLEQDTYIACTECQVPLYLIFLN